MLTPTTAQTSTAEHLADAIKSPSIVVALEPLPGGSFRARTETWVSHWQPVRYLGEDSSIRALERLDAARKRYIESNFDLSKVQEYCFRYFALLDEVLEGEARVDHPSAWERILQLVLAFECFPVIDLSPARGGRCAGTTTLRNPVFLLGKLKAPHAGDDVKSLPLVPLDQKPVGLFFHYRQYRVAADPSFAVLGLLPNEKASRQASLRLAANVGRALHANSDPYARQRGYRLWKGVLLPLLDLPSAKSKGACLEIVDVGSGSGRLSADLCRRYVRWSLGGGIEPVLRLWFVERSGQDPTSLFRDKRLSRYVHGLTVLPSDYQAWLGKRRPLPVPFGLRVGIVSKVFDQASQFELANVDVSALTVGTNGRTRRGDDYLPSRCLAPGGAGAEALVMSASRTSVARGHLYPQLSLASYYRALSIVAGSLREQTAPGQVSLPIRRFDPDSLRTADGSSVLEILSRQCDYLLVEDLDLRPQDLLAHVKELSLAQLRVLDLTNAMGLRDNYSYLIWQSGARQPPVEGERLW